MSDTPSIARRGLALDLLLLILLATFTIQGCRYVNAVIRRMDPPEPVKAAEVEPPNAFVPFK